ncbi:MAG: hypothetical protein IPJ78_17255 [Gemmatimonadetes bacterium]|nr:hypothetical protein [Gemmatimonadota bacterium]
MQAAFIAMAVATISNAANAQRARECVAVPASRTASLDSAQQALGFRLYWPAIEACGPERIVAALWTPERDRDGDFGSRIALLRPTDGRSFVAVSFSRGFLESSLPRVRAFEARGRVLALADLGDEGGSWGIEAFEVLRDSLLALGRLDVGKSSRDDENDGSAFSHLAVALSAGEWQVSFDTVVVLEPNRDSRSVIEASPRRPARFRAHGGTWRRLP